VVQEAPPGGDTLGGEHPDPEGERVGAFVQDGMTKVFVAGVQPGESRDLAGFRSG
jgi:hypothetical protein